MIGRSTWTTSTAFADPWESLRRECHDMSVWYGANADVSAYVGVDVSGTYFGGVHVDGEAIDEIEVEYRNGNAEDVVIGLVREMKAYRKRVDEERESSGV